MISRLYFNLKIPEVLNFMRFLLKVNVQDATAETKFVIFDYEGNRFFKLSASQLYDQNGNSYNTTPELMVQLLVDQELKFQIKIPSYISAYPQTEYTVSRILNDQLTTPSQSQKETEGTFAPGHPSPQSLNSTISNVETQTAATITDVPLPIDVPVKIINVKDNSAKPICLDDESCDDIADDISLVEAKLKIQQKNNKKRKLRVSTSDDE
ncbi:hypothetical protein LINGRAPRIM_LOCUS2281 [Linum grandiflorum]